MVETMDAVELRSLTPEFGLQAKRDATSGRSDPASPTSGVASTLANGQRRLLVDLRTSRLSLHADPNPAPSGVPSSDVSGGAWPPFLASSRAEPSAIRASSARREWFPRRSGPGCPSIPVIARDDALAACAARLFDRRLQACEPGRRQPAPDDLHRRWASWHGHPAGARPKSSSLPLSSRIPPAGAS